LRLMIRSAFFFPLVLMCGIAVSQTVPEVYKGYEVQDSAAYVNLAFAQNVPYDEFEDRELDDTYTNLLDDDFDFNPDFNPVIKPPQKIRLSFAERNSGAFKLRKQGGRKSPWTAAICSAIFPGLGQMYNGQYYKPPVLYGGGFALGYVMNMNLKERWKYDFEIKTRYYETEIKTAMREGRDTLDLFKKLNALKNSRLKNYADPKLSDQARYSDRLLQDVRNYYQNNLELSIIIASAVYLLNIIDAIVYAHLSKFDVSPNLAMKVEPYARTNVYTKSKMPLDAGLSVCLTFK